MWYDFDPKKLVTIHAIIRNSKKLCELYLCMSGFDVLPQKYDFVQSSLEATASRDMLCLSLEDTEIEEEALLKALSA